MSQTRDSTFGDLLRRLRTDVGMTQEQLAERAGLSTRGISDLERGINRWPFRATVEALIGALSPDGPDAKSLRERAVRPPSPRVAPRGRAATPLPIPPTPILGRELEEARALRALRWEGKRLLTLTGTGGVGKTRLALQVASTARNDYAGGAVFVSLGAVNDPDLVPASVATALGIRIVGSVPLQTELAEYIADRELLLVLDNLEHLLPCAPFIADLLSRCPRLKVLATSREPLKLRGEQELAVGPLPVPAARGPTSPEDLQSVPSVVLFLQRVASVEPEFALTAENAEAIAAICCRLEGLPLAIELAAAQIRYFSPRKLGEQLSSRLDTLAGGARDLPPRQQTMRDTIAWSYDLLRPEVQAVFRLVSVFAGGFTEEAAQSVLRTDAFGTVALRELVDKNLLSVDREGSVRYTMLETIREFGVEQLVAGQGADEARRRHAQYFHDFAERASSELTGPDQGAWLDRLDADYGNVLEALSWAASIGDCRSGVELCISMRRFWSSRGRTGEGRNWILSFLERLPESVPPSLRADSHYAVGAMAYGQCDYGEAETHFEQSLLLAREIGDQLSAAHALNGIGVTAYEQGKYDQALTALREAVKLYREMGRDDLLGAPLNNIASIALYRGDLPEAMQLFQESADLHRRQGNQWYFANALNNLALAIHTAGQHGRARDMAEAALTIYRELADPAGQAKTLTTLSAIALDLGANDEARPLIAESLALAETSGERLEIGSAFVNLSTVELRDGQYAHAEALARQALALFEESGTQRMSAYALDSLGDIAQSCGRAAAARTLYERGLRARRVVGDIEGIMSSLERLAGLDCAEGGWHDAIHRYAASQALRQTTGVPGTPVQHVQKEQDLVRLRHAVSPEDFESAWEAGRRAADSLLSGEEP